MQNRKDPQGRVLRKNEYYRAGDGRYSYVYRDVIGRQKTLYANTLSELREKEKDLLRNVYNSIDVYAAGKATVNQSFDRYIAIKPKIRVNTLNNYKYMYDRFCRATIGERRAADVVYSDILLFYTEYLYKELELSYSSIASIHMLLHPCFEMLRRDGIIRLNPCDDCLKLFRENEDITIPAIRNALTREQQRRFLEFCEASPEFSHWRPGFEVLFGTGLRIGEFCGLCWTDIDFEKGIIHIDRSLVYYKDPKTGKFGLHLGPGKTKNAKRDVKAFPTVLAALEEQLEHYEQSGGCLSEVDGRKDFVYQPF